MKTFYFHVAVFILLCLSFSAQSQSGSRSIATSDCSTTIYEYGNPNTLTLPSPTGFSFGCVVEVCNVDPATASNHATLLVGFPTPIRERLYMGQCARIGLFGSAWSAISAPGRFMPPFYPTILVDNAGNDTTGDGLSLATAVQTPQGCYNLMQQEMDFHGAFQPACAFSHNQTFPGAAFSGALVGTNVMFMNCPACNVSAGEVATIMAPSGSSNLSLMQFLDGAPYVITSNIDYSINGCLNCTALDFHQESGMDTWAGTIIDANDANGAMAIHVSSLASINIGADNSTLWLRGQYAWGIKSDVGNSKFTVGNGMQVTGVITNSMYYSNGGHLSWTGPVVANGASVGEFFTLRGSSAQGCLSSLGLPPGSNAGSGGARRFFSVFDGASFLNQGYVIPGAAPGVVAMAGHGPGLAPDSSGGNSGHDAGGC